MGTLDAIDADGHIMEDEALFERYVPSGISVDWRSLTDVSVNGLNIVDRPDADFWVLADVAERYAEPAARNFDSVSLLAMLDREGFAASALYPSKFLYVPFADGVGPDIAYPLARAYNDWLGDYCSLDPARLLHVAVLPLTDVRAAVAEAERCRREHGSCAVMVRPNPVGGRLLGNPYYDPLYDALAELDMALTVHEGLSVRVPQLGRDRFHSFLDRHMCCHPMEQMSACLSLVTHGALERHPELRVAFLESGSGWVPYWMERMDEHYENARPDAPELTIMPSEYFRRQCFVSTEPDDGVVRYTADWAEDCVVFASDYPHPDAAYPGILDSIRATDALSDAVKAKILTANPRRLYGLA